MPYYGVYIFFIICHNKAYVNRLGGIFLFNDRLRTVRIFRGITLQTMADMLSTGLRNYQKYESGDTRPTFEGLVLIADFLNVPIDFLLGRDDYLNSLGVSVDVPPEGPPRHPKPQKNR